MHRPAMSSLWTSCNDRAAFSAPRVIEARIAQVSRSQQGLPTSFAADAAYRGDLVKIICYESTYDFHAAGGDGQYGWFQMTRSLIGSEGVSWQEYWDGGREPAGWYQCLAGERYIMSRYGNPLVAWEHERDYGWY